MTYDEQKAEAFAEEMLDVLNKGALALMTSVGHRTGLFDALATLPPSTSVEIAAAAGLNERYVREWLGAMVTGRTVGYAPDSREYSLPAEHAAVLTRAAAPNNMAPFTQYIGMFGTVEEKIIDCFRNGGGVPYSDFPRFQEFMAEDSGQTVLPALIDLILPLSPGLTERLTEGIDVLDIGCGSGRALILMAKTYPESRFTGVDISAGALETGRAEASEKGLTNVLFEERDAALLSYEQEFDLITTFDAVHDQRDPAAVVGCISRALRNGGSYLMQDIAASRDLENNIDGPIGPFLYTVSTFHCMTVSLAEGGAGLGTMWGRETALEMLAEAGFGDVQVKTLDHDPQNLFYICRK